MGLIEQAKADIEQITSDVNDFAVPMTWTDTNNVSAEVYGLFTKHHLAVDADGNPTNSRNAHVSVAEQKFIDAGITVRNGANQVNLKGHKVTVKDSTGIDHTYTIRQWFPDETIGLIVCILGDLA